MTAAKKFKKNRLQLFLWVFFLGFLYLTFYALDKDPFGALMGQRITIEGHIISAQMPYDDFYKLELAGEAYYIGSRRIEFSHRVLVTIKGSPDYIEGFDKADRTPSYADLVGRTLRITGIIVRPPAMKNPNLFDYALYLKTRNIETILESSSWQCRVISDKYNRVSNALSCYKYDLTKRLKQTMSAETFGLMVGILFGDKNFIDDSTYDAFQKNGTAHILSVSGIHVGIIYAFIEKLAGKGKHPIYNVATVALLLIYAALSGFSPSVDRAVFMIMIFILGKLLNERYDLTTCTAFSAFVLLLYNPYNLLNLGFQLSYLAVFLLAVLLPWLTRLTRRWTSMETNAPSDNLDHQKRQSIRNKAIQVLLPLFAIQIGMVPITAYIFNYFSLSAFIINVPVIMLAGIILPIGIFLMLISLVSMVINPLPVMGEGLYMVLTEIKSVLDFLFSLLATGAEMLVFSMIALNRLTAQRGFWYFDIQNPSPVTLIFFYTTLFLCCSELGQWYFQKKQSLIFSPIQSSRKMIQALSLVILLMLGILFSGNTDQKADLIFLDVGQGDCLHVRTPSGKNILIDGGGSRGLADGGSGYDVGSRILLPYLLKSGVSSIDVAIISHLHDDHYRGIASLSQAMRIDKVVLYSGNQAKEQALISDLRIGADSLIYVGKGDRITIEPGIYLDVLYPDDEMSRLKEDSPDQVQPENENATNLLMKLSYYGITILMTGDLTGEDEAEIIKEERDLQADILKVPHHGSRYSSTADFIKAVNPEIAIIQVGKNNFGHPNPAIVENYLKQDIMLFRTDQDGAILIDIGAGRTVRMRTMLDQHWQTIRL